MPEQSNLHWKCFIPAKPCAWKTTGFTYICGKRAKVFKISLSSLSSRLCGYHSPSEPMTYVSSGNVMLITMATNDKKNYPGFRAQISQVRRGDRGKTGVLREWWLKLTPTLSLFTVHVWLVLQPPGVEASCQGEMGDSHHPTFQITILLESRVSGRLRYC